MSRLQVSGLAAVLSVLLLMWWPVLEWWQFGWAAVLVSLYHTVTAIYVGYLARIYISTDRSLRAVAGGGKDRPAKGRDEFLEGLFNDGIRIGAEEAASRVEELGAVELAARLRQEVKAALPETEARFECWRRMREQEGS